MGADKGKPRATKKKQAFMSKRRKAGGRGRAMTAKKVRGN